MHLGTIFVESKRSLLFLLEARMLKVSGAMRETGMEIKNILESEKTQSCPEFFPSKLRESIHKFWNATMA